MMLKTTALSFAQQTFSNRWKDRPSETMPMKGLEIIPHFSHCTGPLVITSRCVKALSES